MNENCTSVQPIIFPLSNPTSRLPIDLYNLKSDLQVTDLFPLLIPDLQETDLFYVTDLSPFKPDLQVTEEEASII